MERRVFIQLAGLGGLGLLSVACGGELASASSQPAAAPFTLGTERRVFTADGRSFELVPVRHTVDVFDAGGVRRLRIGREGRTPTMARGDLNGPIGVACDTGRIVVLERGNGRLQAFDDAGRSLGAFGPQLGNPTDMAFDEVDRVFWISEWDTHRVLGISADDGRVVGTVGSFGLADAGLNGAAGVALSTDRRLHVADVGNARIQVFERDGRHVASYGGTMRAPRAIRFDDRGRAWVADTLGGEVLVFDAGGALLERTAVVAPVALSAHPAGNMYVATIAAS